MYGRTARHGSTRRSVGRSVGRRSAAAVNSRWAAEVLGTVRPHPRLYACVLPPTPRTDLPCTGIHRQTHAGGRSTSATKHLYNTTADNAAASLHKYEQQQQQQQKSRERHATTIKIRPKYSCCSRQPPYQCNVTETREASDQR